MKIGEKIKQLRIKMNLTQEELGNRCDLSKGFISQVERDLTSPSIATLMDILESLGTNLRDFFNDNTNDKIVFTRDDIFTQDNGELGNKIDWIIPNAQKNMMEPVLIRIKQGGKSETYGPYEGEVFGYVISGRIVLTIGTKEHKAKKGESFYFQPNSAYFIKNNSGSEAEVLWVSSPPNF